MLRLTDIQLPLEHAPGALEAAILKRLGIAASDLRGFSVAKRSHDARKRGSIKLIYAVDVDTPREAELLAREASSADGTGGACDDPPGRGKGGGRGRRRAAPAPRIKLGPTPDTTYRLVAKAPSNLSQRPVVIGTGPCGLFAALLLAQMGYRPIILERGRAVRQRTRDTFGFWRQRRLDPESNVQFGEGGAGTFSDGKLYSQISDPRHLGRKVLEEFVRAGAPEEILYVAKPHIGTFRLVSMVESMRESVEALGGEYRFGCRVDDIEIVDGQVRGVVLADGEVIRTDHVVLAVGHSARDTFEMLHRRGVFMEPKPFSIGARIEHPQSVIDAARFGPQAGHPLLGAADYKLVHHCSNGRTVYSFCMCPGGTVVAAASEPGRVVTNGMSQYSRNERNANAAIVVGITPADFPDDSVLAGVALQRHWEECAYAAGGGTYDAPGQLVGDFLAGRPSTEFRSAQPSYTPAVHLTEIDSCLPEYALAAMREALPAFDRKIPGFAMDDAILTAVETRTSSPVRITRGEDGQSLNTRGLYPAGEGAGYAGGILSAGVDGIRAAEAVGMAFKPA
jgi:uncharacterized protein